MKQRLTCLLLAIVCVLACGAVATALLWAPSTSFRTGVRTEVRTEDRNGDGRPDVWRTFNPRTQLSEVSIDSNFDGRSDMREYYLDGVLVRRESDRDFNDRVDLVQDFDSSTRERVRSVEDVDFDGSADLLVLFQHDQPVFREWARNLPTTAARSAGPRPGAGRSPVDSQLVSLDDPFRADLALNRVHDAGALGDGIGLSTSGGLPAACRAVVHPIASSSNLAGCVTSSLRSASAAPYSPRGPPPSSPLI